jgi:hypothetical protein
MVAWERLPPGVRGGDLYGWIVAPLPRQTVSFVACVTSGFRQGGRIGRSWYVDETYMELVPGAGFEPATFGLQNRCTTTVLTRHGRLSPTTS